MDRKTALKQIVKQHLRPMAPIATGLERNGSLRPPVEALLCDIYGTLMISGSGDLSIARRQNAPADQIAELLAHYGISLSPSQLVQNLHDLIERHHLEARTKGVRYPEVRIEQIWSRLLPIRDRFELACFAVAYEMIVNPAWPMPHLEQLLSACRRRHIALGIISNAQFFTPYLFDGLLDQTAEDLGFNKNLILMSFQWEEAKPSPRLFQAAVQRLAAMGIPPQRTVYIGNDMLKDIAPAAAAGFQTVLFAGDARSLRTGGESPSLGTVSPDLVVTDLLQLIEYLHR